MNDVTLPPPEAEPDEPGIIREPFQEALSRRYLAYALSVITDLQGLRHPAPPRSRSRRAGEPPRTPPGSGSAPLPGPIAFPHHPPRACRRPRRPESRPAPGALRHARDAAEPRERRAQVR